MIRTAVRRPPRALRDDIAAFDGRATTILGEAEARFRARPDYAASLVALAGDAEPAVSSGATWLLKAHLEAGGALAPAETDALTASLRAIAAWDAQLHVCQSVRYLTLSARDAGRLARWLESLLAHERPFLRAWSLDALWRLASRHQRHRRRAEQAFEAAGEDPAASVKARARKLRKEMGL